MQRENAPEASLGATAWQRRMVRSVRWMEGVIRNKTRQETDAGLAPLSQGCTHTLPPTPRARWATAGRSAPTLQKLQPLWVHRCVPSGGQGLSLVFQKGIFKELLKNTVNEPHIHHLTQVGSDLFSFHKNHVPGVHGAERGAGLQAVCSEVRGVGRGSQGEAGGPQ